MTSEAGTPKVMVLIDWHIDNHQVYGFARDYNMYISSPIDKHDDQRAFEGGRVTGQGYQFVLGRPLGRLT